MAQQGYAQLEFPAHLDPFLPGMIATQYPKAIKTGLFQETTTGSHIKFGLGCGRNMAGSVATGTPSNFGTNDGRPADVKHGVTPGAGQTAFSQSPALYSAGGGAIVTESITRDAALAGAVSSVLAATGHVLVVKKKTGGHLELIQVGDYSCSS